MSNRKQWYNPELDPNSERVADGGYEGGPLERPSRKNGANLESSLCEDGFHRLAIDIDGMNCELRESSTPGHYHLLIDHKGLSWDAYKMLLSVLADAGIVERAYVEASIFREQSLLRKPGVPRVTPR